MGDPDVTAPGFPGVCVRCGGPEVWTLVRGEVWVACSADCVSGQDDLFGATDPPMIALLSREEGELELSQEGEVVPPVGGAANESEGRD